MTLRWVEGIFSVNKLFSIFISYGRWSSLSDLTDAVGIRQQAVVNFKPVLPEKPFPSTTKLKSRTATKNLCSSDLYAKQELYKQMTLTWRSFSSEKRVSCDLGIPVSGMWIKTTWSPKEDALSHFSIKPKYDACLLAIVCAVYF